MQLIVTLKDGSEHALQIFLLEECGIYKNTFFIEGGKKGRIEFPIESLSSFRLESSTGRIWEGYESVLNPAIMILTQLLP